MTVMDFKLSPTSKIAEQMLGELGVKKRDINGNNQFGKLLSMLV